MKKNKEKVFSHQEIAIVICGAAGQGINTTSALLTHLLNELDYGIDCSKEHMSRIRDTKLAHTI